MQPKNKKGEKKGRGRERKKRERKERRKGERKEEKMGAMKETRKISSFIAPPFIQSIVLLRTDDISGS